jgi:hypothetical protein
MAATKHFVADIKEKVEKLSLPKITKVSKTEDNKIVVEVKEEGKKPVTFSATKTNNTGSKTNKPDVTQIKVVNQNDQTQTALKVTKKSFRLFRISNKNKEEGEQHGQK